MQLSNEQLLNVNGGLSKWAILGLIAAGVLVVGIIDGYMRPLKCRR